MVETEVFYPCLMRSFFPNYVDIQSASRISSQAFLVICSVQIAHQAPRRPEALRFHLHPRLVCGLQQRNLCDVQFTEVEGLGTCPN